MRDCLPVKDMPDELREAAEELGYDATHEMNVRDAIATWAQWNIGDASWGENILDLRDQFITDLREQT